MHPTATSVGQGIALLFGFIGLFSSPLLLFIALFVWIGAARKPTSPRRRGRWRAFPSRVRALLRRIEFDRGAEIHFADLRLDPVTHKVWRKDKEIGLTAKEYGLLEYFMRNPNQVVTRTMIADHVWDYTFDSFTNIIDVYVNYLRKKIDRDADRKLIHTVRGVGYIFKEED